MVGVIETTNQVREVIKKGATVALLALSSAPLEGSPPSSPVSDTSPAISALEAERYSLQFATLPVLPSNETKVVQRPSNPVMLV